MPDRRRLTWTAVVVLLLVAACGTGTAGGQQPGRPASAPGDAVGLVGLWTVREAAGEEPGAILRLGDGLSLWRSCGHLDGFWRATADGLFIGFVAGGSGACYRGPGPAHAPEASIRTSTDSVPDWLRQAAGYRADGPDRLLVDRDGRAVARLVPGGRPKVDADTAPSEGEPPVFTDALRRMLAPAAALPAGLRPAAAADLVGRWVPGDRPEARSPRPPHVTFAADGDLTGSDGCNAQGGRWLAGPAGAFLAIAGPQTLMSCAVPRPAGAAAPGVPAPVDVGSWLTAASRAGLAGDELVLLDRSGRELGRLRSG
jgi:META domain